MSAIRGELLNEVFIARTELVFSNRPGIEPDARELFNELSQGLV